MTHPDDSDVLVVADRYPARVTDPYGHTSDSRRVVLTHGDGTRDRPPELVVFEARGADAVIVLREPWHPAGSDVPGGGQSAAPWEVWVPNPDLANAWGVYVITRGAGCGSCNPVLGGSFVPFHPYRMVPMPAELGTDR